MRYNISTMSKTVYIKCPRCDLNFIPKKDKLCHVCRQEMQALQTSTVDGDSMGLCPICKVNYITDDETVCGTCMEESELTEEELDALYGGVSLDKDNSDPEDDITDDEDELEIITLDMDGEDIEEESDDEDESDPLEDDFDESFEDDDEEDRQ